MTLIDHRLRYTNSNSFKRLTILIVCPDMYVEPLKEAFVTENNQKYDEKLQLSICEYIEDILSCTEKQQNVPDYIVIFLDPRNRTFTKRVEECIGRIDSTYIMGGRLCLVNGGCSSNPQQLGVSLGQINVLSQKYSVILINGDVLIPEKCSILVSRILQLASSVCGFFTGIPVIVDIPGYENIIS